MTTVDEAVTTRLVISGMTCGHCVQHVESALTALPGVSAQPVGR